VSEKIFFAVSAVNEKSSSSFIKSRQDLQESGGIMILKKSAFTAQHIPTKAERQKSVKK